MSRMKDPVVQKQSYGHTYIYGKQNIWYID